MEGKKQQTAAAMAGMSERSARKWQCGPVQTEHPGCFPHAHPIHHHRPANPQIYVHLIHPSHHPWGRL